ncbi:regulatory associated protein of mTOR, partial [Paragonimus westermani]
MLSNRGSSRSESSTQQFDSDDWDEQSILSTRVAFNASHLCEEIEGATLHEEKHHKEKTKTGAGALVVCLNIDIDPPDVHKIPPYSRVEAWFDPTDANSLRALETIGKNLQAQYDRWQPRARFKQCLDPTLDDVKNLCLNLRRNLKSDRILFHYNGHGVPRPTENGEIWVFNTKFTKYIPLSLYDLQRWLGAPSVYVIDCQNAGRVIRMYEKFCQRRMAEAVVAAQRQHHDVSSDSRGLPNGASEAVAGAPNENRKAGGIPSSAAVTTQPDLSTPHGQSGGQPLSHNPPVSMENTIMLAACRENEDLPQNPELPADLFTACLTTPIRMALRWHWLRHQETFPGFLDETLLDRIPGAHSNRMSLLGEINWIFTAVTDTIAWCSFPIDVFQKLFRQDLLVAGLFRNYLLAERIMKTYGCTPVSAPALPPTFRHSMWDAWDHALDRLVHYLPRMLKLMEGSPVMEPKLPIILPKSSNQLNSHGGIQGQTVSSQLVSPLPVMATDQTVEIAVCQQIPQLGRATTTSATAAAVVAATAAAAVNCGQPHTRATSTSRSDVRAGPVPCNGGPGNLIQQQHRMLVSSRQPTNTNQ